MSKLTPGTGSYLIPRLEHARVSDAMRHGILSCAGDAAVRHAARTMTAHHVHTIVITDPSDASVSGMLTDRALLDALLEPDGGERALMEVAQHNVPTIASDAYSRFSTVMNGRVCEWTLKASRKTSRSSKPRRKQQRAGSAGG